MLGRGRLAGYNSSALLGRSSRQSSRTYRTAFAAACRLHPSKRANAAVGRHLPTSYKKSLLALSTLPLEKGARLGSLVDRPRKRPWMDSERSLENRVLAFVEASRIMPGDFVVEETASLIVDCCKMSSNEGMNWAHDIVDRLFVEKRRLQKQDVLVTVPVDTLQKLMYGWAMRAERDQVARKRMGQLLQTVIGEAIQDSRIFKEAAQKGDERVVIGPGQSSSPLLSEPTVELFNTYLQGLAFASKAWPSTALVCESILMDMDDYRTSRGWHTKPNTRSYTHAITAFRNSQRNDAGENALRILRRMQKVHTTERELYLEKYGVPYDEKSPSANRKRLVTVDVVVYTITMDALVKGKNSPEKVAMSLLQEALDSDHIIADTGIFLAAIKVFASMANSNKFPLKRLSAARNAEAILWRMFREIHPKEKGIYLADQLKENQKGLLLGLNACLDAWARSYVREAVPQCEKILRKVLSIDIVRPDTVSFNSCLYAWWKSSTFYPDAAYRAEKMLMLQHELCAKGVLTRDAMPDFQGYAIVILAYAHSESIQKAIDARRLLDSLIEHVKAGDIRVSRNPAAPFSAVLSAVARSPSSVLGAPSCESGENAPVDAFNSVIGTTTDSFAIAEKTYKELQEDRYDIGVSPDHHAYGAFLRCIAQHTFPDSSERDGKARMVFEDACEAGCVSRLVVDGLKASVGESMLGIPELQTAELPRFWTRKVPRPFRFKHSS